MLHRIPTRQPRRVLLCGVCMLGVVLSMGLGVFYAFYAPNWDVPMLCALVAAVLLWPCFVSVANVWGEYRVQIEHAGVVIIRSLWGLRLSRRVWLAEQIRYFDWEETDDGLLSLRFLLLRSDGKLAYASVLHTDAPYAMGAVLRDMELHYPGCGLYEQRPLGMTTSGGRGNRWLSLILCFGGLWMLWQFGSVAGAPLCVAYGGRVLVAEVQGIEWGRSSANRRAPYYLRLRPLGTNEVVRTADAFSPDASPVPRPGDRLEILYKPGAVCYLPGEVAVFLLPLPGIGAGLLLGWLGVWGIMRSGRHLH